MLLAKNACAFLLALLTTLGVLPHSAPSNSPSLDSDGDGECTYCPYRVSYSAPGCACVFGSGTVWDTNGICNAQCQETTPCQVTVSISFALVVPCITYCVVKVRGTPLDPWQTPATLNGGNVDPACGATQPIGEVGAFTSCNDTSPACTFVVYVGCYNCM